MKRLTIYLRNQKKVTIEGKEKLFNVKSYHNVSEEDAKRIIYSFKRDHVQKALYYHPNGVTFKMR